MSNLKAEVFSWLKTIVFAVVVSLFITNFVIVNASVPSASMENMIMTKDRLVAFRLSYLFNPPKRYDVVVFRYPDDPARTTLYVKRIIGMPGETVLIKDGKVYIDGSDVPLDDGFIKEPPVRERDMTFSVPEGHYFMLGDHRNISLDSRDWQNKYVSERDILGRVIFRYLPSFKVFDRHE